MTPAGIDATQCYARGYQAGLKRGRADGREQGYRDAVRWMSRLNTDSHARQTFLLLRAMRQLDDMDWGDAEASAEYELQAGLRESYAAIDHADDDD